MDQKQAQEDTHYKYTWGNKETAQRRETQLNLIDMTRQEGRKLNTLTPNTGLQSKTGNIH